jgi:integrase
VEYYDPAIGYSRIESSGSTNPRVAERLLRDREKAKDDGKMIVVGAHRTMMRDLFDLVITDKTNNKRKAVETEQQRIDKHLLPFFGSLKAIHVTFDTIESYKRSRIAEGAANGTINRELALIRQGERLGVRHGKVSHIPQINFLDEDNVRKGFFEEDTFHLLLKELPEELKPLHIFDYFTGIRHDEALSILWDQVDRLNAVIRLESTKSGEPREIYYAENKEMCGVVEQQWKMKREIETRFGRPVEHLFFRYSGTGRGTEPGDAIKDFRGAFNRALKAAGIENYEYIKDREKVVQKRIFHDLRRTAIRNLRRAGVDRATDQAGLGP